MPRNSATRTALIYFRFSLIKGGVFLLLSAEFALSPDSLTLGSDGVWRVYYGVSNLERELKSTAVTDQCVDLCMGQYVGGTPGDCICQIVHTGIHIV